MTVVFGQATSGAASTQLPGGAVERYHHPHFDICHEPSCLERHASHAELNTFTEAE